MSSPAVIAPSGLKVTVNDLRMDAALSTRFVQLALGAICSSARRTCAAIFGAKAPFFSTSHSTVAQSRASAFSRNTSRSTVLPTPLSPVMIIDCST